MHCLGDNLEWKIIDMEVETQNCFFFSPYNLDYGCLSMATH